MRSSRLLSMLAVLLLACGAPTLAIENTVVLAPAIAARLLEAKPGQRIEVGAVPRNAGAQAPAVFKRIEVYAADARIVVMGDAGPVEVPRSTTLHYISVEGPRVALSLDPDTGAGEGLLIADDGINYSLAARSRDGGLELAIDRRADRTPAGIPLVYSSESRSDVREPSASQLLESSSSDSESTNAIDAVAGGTRQAVVKAAKADLEKADLASRLKDAEMALQSSQEKAQQSSRQKTRLQKDHASIAARIASLEKTIQQTTQQDSTIAETLTRVSEQEKDLAGKLRTAVVETQKLEEVLTVTQQKSVPRDRLQHRLLPVTRPADANEQHYRVSNGKVSLVPLEDLLERLKAQVLSKRATIMRFNQFEGTVGPDGGYTMNYTKSNTPDS